jgi:drug/metabolite transporter (DMT)-like permease
MPLSVFLAVLFGAALHAGWNAIVKGAQDKLLTTIFVSAASGAVAAVALPFLAQPAPASWPYIAASASIQVLYLALVAAAYRAVDMSLAYPLMRGAAPVLVAAAGVGWLGERLSPGAWAGVALVSAGVLAMALTGRAHATRAGVAIALANACVIAAYTLIDGAGVRLSGAPVAYAMWLFLLNALPLVGWALIARRGPLLAYARRNLWPGLVGGIGNLVSYGLALWAMTGAPVAMVAALRETSILFGLAIAGLLLREPLGPRRLAAAALIALGAVALRLA